MGVEVGFQVLPSVILYSGAGISYRIPIYTDLYYKGPTNIGNDQLVPEQAQNFEFGAKWNKAGFMAELVYFNRNTDNLIEWTRPDSTTPWQPQNFNEVTFNGIEASLNYRVNPTGKSIQVREFMVSYNYINTNLTEKPGTETRYALSDLRNQIIGGILVAIGPKVEWNTKMRYVERESQDPYFVLDMRADYNRLGKLGFFCRSLQNHQY